MYHCVLVVVQCVSLCAGLVAIRVVVGWPSCDASLCVLVLWYVSLCAALVVIHAFVC